MNKKKCAQHNEYIKDLFNKLTPGEISDLTNGCGPMNNRFLAEVIPELVFNIACKIHDIAFLCGGDDKDRTYSNEMFYEDMCNAIRKQTKWKRWFYFPLAKTYVWFVSGRFGKKSFSYREKILVLKEVKKLAFEN